MEKAPQDNSVQTENASQESVADVKTDPLEKHGPAQGETLV